MIVRSFGRLKGIITTRLESGDPSLTVLEMEMKKDEVLSRPILLQSLKGIVAVNISERQPPAPPVEGEVDCAIERTEGGRDEIRKGEEAMATDGGRSGELIMTGLGTENQRDRRSEKGESLRGSVDSATSREESNTFSSHKTQGGGRKRISPIQVRKQGKRLLKGDISGRHVRYERRKLFIKGDGGVKIWLAVGKGRKMRVPAGWKMVRVGYLRLRQIVGSEKAEDGGREVVGEESSTDVPETNPASDEVDSELRRVRMGECGGFTDNQKGERGMQGST